MFGFLYSWFIGQWGPTISCTKTQTLPNSRISDPSAHHMSNVQDVCSTQYSTHFLLLLLLLLLLLELFLHRRYWSRSRWVKSPWTRWIVMVRHAIELLDELFTLQYITILNLDLRPYFYDLLRTCLLVIDRMSKSAMDRSLLQDCKKRNLPTFWHISLFSWPWSCSNSGPMEPSLQSRLRFFACLLSMVVWMHTVP